MPITHEKENKKSNNHQHLLRNILIAIIIGAIVGGFLPKIASNFEILGELFLNSLMMIVIPLVMFSMIIGITSLGDIRKVGALGKNTILYYLITTGLSVFIGLVLVNIIQPGSALSPGEKHSGSGYRLDSQNNNIVFIKNDSLATQKYDNKYKVTLMDQNISGIIDSVGKNHIIVNYWQPHSSRYVKYLKTEAGDKIPIMANQDTLISAEPKLKLEGMGIKIGLAGDQSLVSKEGQTILSTIKEVLIGNREANSEGIIPRNIFNAMVRMDILPIIVFALLIGAALSVVGEPGLKVIQVIQGLNAALMKLVSWIMKVAPFGIFGLIAARIGNAGGFSEFIPELMAVARYSLTVIIGLSFHAFITLPLILSLFGKRQVLEYVRGIAPALFNAFSTASSSATLPLTMNGVEMENKISGKTAGFVLPLGATINMDGTALYEAVAAMFIAQVYGISLGFMQQLVIFLTATLAAIGAAGIPQAGLVTMVIVLKAVNLPVEGIGLILTVDWILDRFRTTVNVWGDSIGCAVVERFENGGKS
ncbi:MAG: dicarboxylate/amino acid:cation symporter [Candidatus Marinimicrobia bacterium]|nr:dicarboxylate/amino acid:cation symporter [Candidatus Neomarinimicrobiota bacterium]